MKVIKSLASVCSITMGLIFIVMSPSIVFGSNQNYTSVGRYLTVQNEALVSQVAPLQEIVQVRFPVSVKTVGDAINYLLRFSSYRLSSESSLVPEVRNLLKIQLPESDRILGPLSLKDSLLTLAGEPFGLIIDPVNRFIAFRLLSPYQVIYKK